jgi:mannose-1-phosphate guanylyltransferase
VPKETASRYGCVVRDPEHAVTHYVEKPESFVSDLISCGVYVLHPDVLGRRPVTEGKMVRLEQDVLMPMAGTGHLFVYETALFWRQLKTAGY